MKACVDVIVKKPIVPVEDHHQQFTIDAFMEELSQRQFHGASNSAIARNLLDKFWEKNTYDDLMMVNKFELELLTQVTVVPLFNDPHDLKH
eukprot:2083993-Ditylum_brightwellii.AAC.1